MINEKYKNRMKNQNVLGSGMNKKETNSGEKN
jgi:hypothetical protein